MHVIRCYSLRSASRRPCRMQTGRSTRGGCARPRRTRARTKRCWKACCAGAGRHLAQRSRQWRTLQGRQFTAYMTSLHG
ncbi:hypothetical protein QJQ45_017097 [Haematococcus lacustris]|nr:hypothetical protein QJQ45_017097 [Haematococcus lacustris]